MLHSVVKIVQYNIYDIFCCKYHGRPLPRAAQSAAFPSPAGRGGVGLLNTKNGNYTPLYILRLCNRRFKDLDIIRCGLSYLATRLHVFRCGGNREAAIKVDSREDHALALFAHHPARRGGGASCGGASVYLCTIASGLRYPSNYTLKALVLPSETLGFTV